MIEIQDISTSIAQDLHRLLLARNEITTIEINSIMLDFDINNEVHQIKNLMDIMHSRLLEELKYHKSSSLLKCEQILEG